MLLHNRSRAVGGHCTDHELYAAELEDLALVRRLCCAKAIDRQQTPPLNLATK